MMTLEEFIEYAMSIQNELRIEKDCGGKFKVYYFEEDDKNSIVITKDLKLEDVKRFVFIRELTRLQMRGNFSIEEMRTFFMEVFNDEQ